MLPLQQAREVRDSIIEYIKATFRFKEKDVSDAFYRFIEDIRRRPRQAGRHGPCPWHEGPARVPCRRRQDRGAAAG